MLDDLEYNPLLIVGIVLLVTGNPMGGIILMMIGSYYYDGGE